MLLDKYICICKYIYMLLKQFIKVTKALGDETRLKILRMLLSREDMCVCELQTVLGLSQPNVSRHLKILEEAGFLEGRREGQWIIYQIRKELKSPLIKGILKEISRLDEDREIKEILKRAQETHLRR